MIIFGITGGSGAGKSTVSELFRSMGVRVIDADKTAHEVVRKGTKCLEELTRYFGSGILKSDGTLDRKRLGNIVFSDGAELKKLNEITHKYIKMEIEKQLAETDCDFAAIDGAVIIGSEIEAMCRFMVSVLAERDVRIKRITERDGISRESAEKRLASQPDDYFYIEHSDYLIYNNGDVRTLSEETEKIFNKIKMRYNE